MKLWKNSWSFNGLVLGFCLLFVNGVFAQGNVDGYILGEVAAGGNGVAGATVTVRNVDTGATRSEQTSENGNYRFSRLPTGNYEVIVEVTGYQGASREVTVNVGQGTPANFSLRAGNVEEIVVTGANLAPVDVTLAETTTVITALDIERLPIPRDVNAVALMAPGSVLGDSRFGSSRVGTASHYSTGFGLASFGGASVGENVYYINGMNVTNFRNGLGGSTVPFEFYDQFQLKTGGFGAEFGRSTGGVLNSVTRRGTNEWNFRAGYNYTPEKLRGHSPDVGDPKNPGEYDAVFSKDSRDEVEAFFSAGGPIIEDKLFFYGIFNHRENDVVNYTGGSELRNEINDDPFWGVKIDWLINENHSIELTSFSDESQTVRTSYDWNERTDIVGEELGDTLIDRGGENYIVKYTGNLTDNFTLSLLGGTSEYNLTTQAPADSTCPLAYDSREGGLTRIGCWTNDLPEAGFDEREVYRIDAEWAINDRHVLRFGVDNETNTSTNTRAYSGPRGDYFRYFLAEPGEELSNGGIVPAGVNEVVRYRVLSGGGEFETLAESYYIEDEWLVTDTITLRLGLRNERFDNRNALGDTFIKVTDQWAPRVGVAWDIKGDGTSKLFANFGRYHLPIASNTNIRLAGSELFTEDWYTLGGAIQADGSVALGTKLGPTSVFGDGSIAPVEETIDTGIQPMYQDEFILGYETELWDGYVGSVTYTYRDLGRGIEDITIDEAVGLPGEFHYILANPGNSVNTFYDVDGDGVAEELNLSADALGFPEVKRRYHALNFILEKTWANGFYARANYTWSHSYGNYEGMVRSDNGQDDAGITNLYDFAGLVQGAYGDLPNDRRHALKLFGAWEFAPGWQASIAATYLDGRPLNAFGVHPTDDFAALYGADSFYNQGQFCPRGCMGRSDAVKNVDVGVKYIMDFANNSSLTFRADVFNIFNFDTATGFDETADEESGVAAATFGLPTWYQNPLTVRVGVTYDFGL